jgi:hypothetical protein
MDLRETGREDGMQLAKDRMEMQTFPLIVAMGSIYVSVELRPLTGALSLPQSGGMIPTG